MTVIPNPPSQGDTFLNEVTGVTYEYDGEKWVIIKTPASETAEQINEDLTDLTSRVVDGETVQGQIQSTISDALDAQSNIKDSIIELEEEIESLAPSLDRGKWNLATLGAGVTLASGEYAMGIGVDSIYCQEKYLECVANANNDPVALGECSRLVGECETAKDNGEEYFINDWSHATFLHFHKTDSDGKNHTFSDYEVGMFIDLFDQGDTGFAVFKITDAPTLDGEIYTIGVTPIQHEGEASGLARTKVFELDGLDPAEFLRKSGDSMKGQLSISPTGRVPALYIYPSEDTTENTYCIRQFGQPYTAEDGTTKRDTVFYTTSEGYPSIHSDHKPTSTRHLTPKWYVDDLVKEYASAAWVPQGRKFKFMAGTTIDDIGRAEFGWDDDHKNSIHVSWQDIFGNSVMYTNFTETSVTGFIKIARPSGSVRMIGRVDKVTTGELGANSGEKHTLYSIDRWLRINREDFTPGSEWYIYDGLFL